MTKVLSLTAGLAVACLLLASPSQSQAHSYGPSGCTSGYGSGYGGYTPGYGGGYGRYTPSYGGGYGGGYNGYAPGSGGGYGGYGGYGRPAIVHPEYGHWTPGRGYHEHGHIHVP